MPIKHAVCIQKTFFCLPLWYVVADFVHIKMQRIIKYDQNAPMFGNFVLLATIQERLLLARVRYILKKSVQL